MIAGMPRGCCHPRDLVSKIAESAARSACDILVGAWDRGAGRSGWVSLPLDPRTAERPRSIVREARRLWRAVRRPNLFVGIPATDAGIAAAEELVARGIPVDIGPVCSAARHRAAAAAYARGVRRLVAVGGDPRSVASVASVPVCAIEREVDRRLGRRQRSELHGRAGIAAARAAYRTFERLFTSAEWEPLEAAGASPQWCVWVVDRPESAPGVRRRYLTELARPHTVLAVSTDTVDHGGGATAARPGLLEGSPDSGGGGDLIERAGIDMRDVSRMLERETLRRSLEIFDESERFVDEALLRAAA